MKKYLFGLKAAKEIINNNTVPQFEIKEVWADFGAGIKHQTLVKIADDHSTNYQLLSIAEAEKAKLGLLDMREVGNIIDKINERGW